MERLSFASKIVLIGFLLLTTGMLANAQLLVEDYNSIPIGSLPASHIVIIGSASVQTAIQKDGTSGNVLAFGSGIASAVRLDIGQSISDVSVSADVAIYERLADAFVMVRTSEDGLSGYKAVLCDDGYRLHLIRVDNGSETVLVHTTVMMPNPGGSDSGWVRLGLEVRGTQLRAYIDSSEGDSEATADDDRYASGYVMLGYISFGYHSFVGMDNVSVDGPIPLVSSETSLPFTTGFEDAELRHINSIDKHPNIDLVKGGYCHITEPTGRTKIALGLDGASSGTTKTLLKVNTMPISDVSVSADVVIYEHLADAFVMVRASGDGLSGYKAVLCDGGYRLHLIRVDNGSETVLVHTVVRDFFDSDWVRLGLEVRGTQLRAYIDKSEGDAEAIADDDRYASGYVMLGSVSTGYHASAGVDNVSVDGPIPLVSSETSLPFTTGFEDAELRHINSIDKHPNIDIVQGGYDYITEPTTGKTKIALGLDGSSLGTSQTLLKVNIDDTVPVSDVSVSADVNLYNYGRADAFVMVRASQNEAGLISGYKAMLCDNGNRLHLLRVDNGVDTLLVHTVVIMPNHYPSGNPDTGWMRLGLEARGTQLRAYIDSTEGDSEAIAVDNRYASGGVMLGDVSFGYHASVGMDNVSVKEPIPLLSTKTSLPFTTGFEDAELRHINSIDKHPNIDIVQGGYDYITEPTTGKTKITLGLDGSSLGTSQTLLKVNIDDTVPISDISVSADVNLYNQGGGRADAFVMVRASEDGLYGYKAMLCEGGNRLHLIRVDNGIDNPLAYADATMPNPGGPDTGWVRLGLEVRGTQLRAYIDSTEGDSEAIAVDNRYASGGVMLGDISTGYHASVGVDNVCMQEGNSPPVVDGITAPLDPVRVNTEISASASFTDQNTLDTHTASWDWGDGSSSASTVAESDGSGTVSGSHSYSQAGVYTIKLTVTDNYGASGESICQQYVVVYDPSAGFVTGGGWIESPTGACTSDTSLTGKANFGFVSKYQKGATVPTGQTEFQFKLADLNFHSDTYDWLVIAGAKAQYKGIGTINGDGEYSFMLTAIDGQINGGGGVDKFRIKIWDKATESIAYDNQMESPDDADPSTVIGGGSIVIHKDSEAAPEQKPNATSLLSCYPNPANPEVWMPYQLSVESEIAIRIYDISGRLVRTLELGYKTVGFYVTKDKAAYWDGNNEAGEQVSSGLYFYTIQAGGFVDTKKLLILR